MISRLFSCLLIVAIALIGNIAFASVFWEHGAEVYCEKYKLSCKCIVVWLCYVKIEFFLDYLTCIHFVEKMVGCLNTNRSCDIIFIF